MAYFDTPTQASSISFASINLSRKFRAAIHRLEKDGPENVEWNGSGNVVRSLARRARSRATTGRRGAARCGSWSAPGPPPHRPPPPPPGAGFGPNFSAEGASVRDPSQWAPGVIFRNDVLRTDEQLGVFGEVKPKCHLPTQDV